jgi:hypothetical protein
LQRTARSQRRCAHSGSSTSAATIDPQRQPEVAPERQTSEPTVCEELDAKLVKLRMSVMLEP